VPKDKRYGVMVAWYRDGRTGFLGFGHHSRKDHRPLTIETLFEIGSVTKVFTGILLAQMAGEGSRRRSVASH